MLWGLWSGGALGINFSKLMKGVRDAVPAKDAMVEGGSLMARAIGQAVVASISVLAASNLARQVAGWRVGAHGVGWDRW